MFEWKKIGMIYNPCEDENRPSWRWNFAQGQNILIFDEFVRVYFCCREKPNEFGQTLSRISYVDLDRKNLKKIIKVANHPVLELGGLGEFDEFGTYPFSVIQHEDKIYGYYGGVTRCESVPFNVSIGCCISEDNGEYFKKIGKGPVLSCSVDEPFVICSPKVRRYGETWYLIYSAGRSWIKGENNRPEICYKLRMATSKDGVNWDKVNKDLIPNRLGIDEAQACGDVIYLNGKYHMFFCYRANLDFRKNIKNSYRIGYAYSYDLYNWIRQDELAGINVSEDANAWDNEMVAYPNVFELDGKIYMLYLGNEVGKYGFGLAELEGELR